MNLCLTTLAATAFTLATASASISFAATTSSNGTLVALGDSITFGYNLDDTQHNSVVSQNAFPVLIGQADHYTVNDLGIPGWTSGDMLSALATPLFREQIQHAGAITLDIGSNDLLHLAGTMGLLGQAASGTPIQLSAAQQQQFQAAILQFGKNFAAIVTQIRTLSNAPLVIYNLYDPFPTGTALHGPSEEFQTIENGIIATVAASAHAQVADAHAAFDSHQLTYVDLNKGDVHPTVLGQTALAQIGESALSTALSAGTKPFNDGNPTATAMVVGDLSPAASGTLSGTLNGSTITLTVPAGALSQETEMMLYNQALNGFTGVVPIQDKLVADASVEAMAGVTYQQNVTLTIANPAITTTAEVWLWNGTSLSRVPDAFVTAGKATITTKAPGTYLVTLPVQQQPTTVVGATTTHTGLPFATEGLLGLALVLAGGAVLYFARRNKAL